MTKTATNSGKQPPLPFTPAIVIMPFVVAPANASTLSELDHWAHDWQDGAGDVPMIGVKAPNGCGKTRIAQEFMARMSGTIIRPDEQGNVVIPDRGPFAVDDADQATGHALISVYNAATSQGRPVLLTGKDPKDSWGHGPGSDLPDLKTRLKSFAALEVEPPDEMTLATVLKRSLDEVGIKVPDRAIETTVGNLRRRYSAVETIVRTVVLLAHEGETPAKTLLQTAMRDNPDVRL